ncbi:MAG: 4Fe-4S ferredoxin [Candidatus Latescibacterota bacterium]|nr:MAG: 4Fe-4S ferredoxin [Candidatus Latescibacterota bacterium]
MPVDIACVGFGPATGGFLSTLSRALADGDPAFESRAVPGMPLQVVCYERADDISFGVSGVATRAHGIRESFPDLDPAQIPMAHPVGHEKLVYLLDPLGTSRRSATLRGLDRTLRALRRILPLHDEALELPWIPGFMRKENGLLLSLGQFNAWVGAQLMGSGQVQVWPGMPVSEPLLEEGGVAGVRLVDQGLDAAGKPESGYMPGMDIRAALTVIGDGPVGAVGQRLDEHFGLPEGNLQRDWAVGMKMVVDLPEACVLPAGTVLHTIGYPEPEIFGFLYVYPNNTASLGIFLPSWLHSPVRASYRYLQHWMQHPYVWQHLDGGTMRSWGAKTLQESGRRGEPHLVGDGYARIGEGSGSTNVLTGSGVDEAWTTGTLLAEGVLELLAQKRPFTRENLEAAYVQRRRQSWVEKEGRVAEHARDGFQLGFVRGLLGMGLAGLTRGRLHLGGRPRRAREHVPTLAEYYRGRIPAAEIESIRETCASSGTPLHEALMERAGWPPVRYDGKLLVSHQDALLLGGKVQAPPGYANHVIFLDPSLCEGCQQRLCVGVCSGQAITPGDGCGVPQFDREKCVHCGACLWSCTQAREGDPERGNIAFRAGAGGLHSAEN